MLKELVVRAVKMRGFLLLKKKGNQSIETIRAHSDLKKWLEFSPRATDDHVKVFIRKPENMQKLKLVCPSCPSGKSILEKVNLLIQ